MSLNCISLSPYIVLVFYVQINILFIFNETSMSPNLYKWMLTLFQNCSNIIFNYFKIILI